MNAGQRVGKSEAVNTQGRGGKYVIESTGERFMWIRLLPGWNAKLKRGEQIKVQDCAFEVKLIKGQRVMLEGIE